MSVTVIVPFSGGCSYRRSAWNWAQARWRRNYPVWKLTEAPSAPGPWCKANAVNPAVRRAQSSIIVLSDADVWTDGVADAVEAVRNGAPWAIPHRMLYRLTAEATADVLGGAQLSPEMSTVQRPYVGIAGGGVVVARRDTLLSVGLDARFVGWGQEDEAHATALNCLAGAPWRGDEPMFHLFHPPQERRSRKRGSLEGWQLRKRYQKARYNPARMRALLDEPDSIAESPMRHHDHRPVR